MGYILFQSTGEVLDLPVRCCPQLLIAAVPKMGEATKLHALTSGREAEGGGLPIHPALFVLTPFHLFRVTYDALICVKRPHCRL